MIGDPGSVRRLSALLMLNLVPQALLGVGLFALNPGGVFPGIDPTGALCLRIAAFGNVPQVLVGLYALRQGDARLLRLLVLACASYHLLAGAQAVLYAFILPFSALTEACRGPALFHPLMFALLALGGWPRAREPVPAC